MYVRMVTFHVKPHATRDDAERIYVHLMSELCECQGFRGLTALLNEESRQAISMSYWDNQEDAAAAGQKTLPLLMDEVHSLVDQPPDVNGYWIVGNSRESERTGN